MRQRLNQELQIIHEKMIMMSSVVEENLDAAVTALLESDLVKAAAVIERDNEVDAFEKDIEDRCIALIATQSPMAGDLRRIFTILKLITDLERIGDHAENIARVVRNLGGREPIKPLIDIPKMAKISRVMIDGSIRAYIEENLDLAAITAKRDDEVDALYKNIYNELLDLISGHGGDDEYRKQAIGLLLIGRYLERIADHATNICERVGYMITGERQGY